MKIKLIIIDTFDYDYHPAPPNYFFDESHMDNFVYSPKESSRVIETVFNNTAFDEAIAQDKELTYS